MPLWKRFWCPRNGTFSLADDGFLIDPDDEHSKYLQPDVVPFERIGHLPCLALLGEPGIGKSTALRAIVSDIEQTSTDTGHQMLSLDLREFGTEDRLERHLIQSRQFTAWTNDNSLLTLVMDSLDECQIQIPHVAALLLALLRDHRDALNRMRLRIACRTADWPIQLESGLAELWTPDGYRALELLPLRRRDVTSVAESAGIDVHQFISAVTVADAQPLAIKPITLRFLIDVFKEKGAFPSTQAALYEAGCRLLCSESSPSRRDARHTGLLDPASRVAIASRIAAVMTLCRKTAVTLDPMYTARSHEILSLVDLTGGSEQSRGIALTVHEEAIRETLATGLFSSRGTQLLGFSHQTYAEYLTARYLLDHKLDLKQLTSLLCCRDDPTLSIVPQLAETTAWFSSMSRSFFKLVMASDPLVLFRSDAASADGAEREALLDALLARLDKGESDGREVALSARYARFAHPRLADQLRPYIADKSKDTTVRRVAIQIAETVALRDLQELVTAVALDHDENYSVRDRAAHAIAQMGDDTYRLQLAPLLALDPNDDPDDQLRGCALRALWTRSLIGLPDVLAAILPPQNPSFLGTYYWFLAKDFVPLLKPNQLSAVLRWLVIQHEPDDDGIDTLSDAVVQKALDSLDDAATREGLADYILGMLQSRDSICSHTAEEAIQKTISENVSGRHHLTIEIVHRATDAEQLSSVASSSIALVTSADFNWLIQQAVTTKESDLAVRYAVLARYVFSVLSRESIDQLAEAAQLCTAIRDEFSTYLKPVLIESEEAQKLKDRFRGFAEIKSRHKSRTPVVPPMTDVVKQWLARFEGGEVDAWWQLNVCMLFDHFGEAGGRSDLEDDLRDLPGWKDADERTRQRIIQAARLYLDLADPNNNEWLGTNILYRPAYAGYRALVLLAHEDMFALSGLSKDLWAKWAAIVLGYPISVTSVGNEQPALDLVALAYTNAPEATVQALSVIIEKENTSTNGAHLFILHKLQNCWDGRLCAAMHIKAQDPRMEPGCVGDLLKVLLEHGCAEAKLLAKSLVKVSGSTDERSRSLAKESAIALVEHADDAGWSVVWPAFQADLDFGASVIESIAHWHAPATKLVAKLTEDEAANLYIWLVRRYPHDQDPHLKGAHAVGPREAAGDFRDSVIRALEERATVAAIAAIQRIVDELPQLSWLKRTFFRARDRMHRQTWIPPRPEELLGLCSQPTTRLVRSTRELQDLLIEALHEIEADLQGETPAAVDLWNVPTSRIDRSSIRPKDEGRLSDWLKRAIRAKVYGRGFVALREVEIRHGEGAGNNKSPGERTDLLVLGVVPGLVEGTFDTVRVIVEVKGCWHPEVKSALKDQLVDRYLKDNDCQHGVYIVGWFRCPQWDDTDQRKAATPPWTVESAREFFNKQATTCSSDERTIRSMVLNTALR